MEEDRVWTWPFTLAPRLGRWHSELPFEFRRRFLYPRHVLEAICQPINAAACFPSVDMMRQAPINHVYV